MDKLETLLACLPPSDFKNIFTAEIEQLRQRVQELEKDRDKVTQYWQIAEGRCDALKQQRDELLATLEEVKGLSAATAAPIIDAAIASVKEK